ncbi:MAG: DUF1501 domain-containing protein [Planctomycetota bacterium]|jgi:uncharacterized protein (DUF1501 family)
MSVTRREFLATGALGAAAASLGHPFLRDVLAAPEQEIAVKPAVIVLFLRGGQDALNLVVPYTEGRYYEIRPNIAIPTPDQPNGALDLDGTFGFHPALKGLKALYDEGVLAPVVCAGSKHPSRSHFDCQDFMEYGAPGDKTVHTGWLNRYLQTTAGPEGPEGEFRALAMQGRLPRSLRGDYPVLAVPDSLGFSGRQRRPEDEDVLDLFDPLYKAPPSMEGPPGTMGERPDEDDLTQNGRTTIETLRQLEEIITTRPAGKEVTYPQAAGRLGQQLKKAARVLKSGRGLEVVGVDWNGWDHHINQGTPEEGQLYWRMLAQLDAAITTFFDDISNLRSRVTMLVMTEFGRTNVENGNLGTDHGHGGVMMAIGGKVKGGKVYGDWTTLAPGRTYQNRDLEVTTDFRAVMNDVLYSHLKLHESKNLFKGFDASERAGLYA